MTVQPSSPTAVASAAVTDPDVAHRTRTRTVQVMDAAGRPAAGAQVTVEQVGHGIAFGCIGFDETERAWRRLTGATPDPAQEALLDRLDELWFGLFDTATLPFYWGTFEPRQGAVRTAALREAAEHYVSRGARVKGHPLVWHTVAPRWLEPYPDDEVLRLLRERVRRDAGEFAGLVDTWDAINEVVIMPVFTKDTNAVTRVAKSVGRVGMVQLAFDEARAANPAATLLLNDFDMSADYEHLVEDCLAAGVRIDALGLQSHMHQGAWGRDKTLDVLERFGRFGLPLHFTETTMLSGELMPKHLDDLNDHRVDVWPSTPDGLDRQAEEMVAHYRTLVADARVQAITYWGLSDHGMWLNAPGGLVFADGTPKPAYDALRGLVRGQWWLAPTRVTTDEQGRVGISGLPGRYVVEVDGTRHEVTLDDDGTDVVVR
ncbi:endo-1,4-beta-xylanase [Cellulomonas sp. zg-ZUI199]|uniref:Beta-xylanase n=1 Tax=Cellulomonas wangleii TaxID=2816956 RepID=A0ABX8D4K3_9CELL|nr:MULTISPECIES: endo-1,4-beta-xylanase [Cellulomonas]MBO0900142.1 endo-1,4-beta-xylanase [Cellulomonas sp. zg-ZUI22]MBO0925576.1 endo-1,4-beta-xylanase [Cellulomonas wangleii]QVI60962.1 endo-1,4-beta-xylanase [Cellulomonas wangleii]